jgi:hypothetical protein
MAKRCAILVGIDGYEFRPLASAVNDVISIRDALVGLDDPSLPKIVQMADVTLLATPEPGKAGPCGSLPATRHAILAELKAHYDNPDPAEFLLVYFAGHGLVTSPDGRVRETLILPSDVPDPEDGRNMICIDELLRLFAERGPRQQVWIVDACRDMPYKSRPRGYEIHWPEQPPPGVRAQAKIFAVAQGGTALSEAGGQGRFTTHLVAGLAGRGCAADYVPGRGHCVTVQSLYTYTVRRVREALVGYDDWTRAVQQPQLENAGPVIDPLRDLIPPPPCRFVVTVQPLEAEPAVDLALEVQAGLPVKGWPPEAPPRIYELRAALRPGMEREGWGKPRPVLSAVDLREEESAIIEVPRVVPPSERDGVTAAVPEVIAHGLLSEVRSSQGLAPLVGAALFSLVAQKLPVAWVLAGSCLIWAFLDPLISSFKQALVRVSRKPVYRSFQVPRSKYLPTTTELGIAPLETRHRSGGPLTGVARLTVGARDPGLTVHLIRIAAPWEQVHAAPNEPLGVAPGPWEVLLRLGPDTVAATRIVLGDGEERTVAAVAQITPVTAALLPPDTQNAYAPETVSFAEKIGPVQAAILPTLLPLLALKPFDTQQYFASTLQHLSVAVLGNGPPPLMDHFEPFLLGIGAPPFSVTIAFDGSWPDAGLHDILSRTNTAGASLIWTEARRIKLYVGNLRGPRETVSIQFGSRAVLDVAAPAVPGGVTVVTVTLWSDGRLDSSICIFRLPMGRSWEPQLPGPDSPETIARAVALGSRWFQDGANLEEGFDEVVTNVANAKWFDPILGALAFHARDRRLAAESTRLNEPPAEHLWQMREIIRRNMAAHFPDLPDSRVIAALKRDIAARRRALMALLDDENLGQPVLTASLHHLAAAAIEAGRNRHWAVQRLDRIPPGQVYNAVRIEPEG